MELLAFLLIIGVVSSFVYAQSEEKQPGWWDEESQKFEELRKGNPNTDR